MKLKQFVCKAASIAMCAMIIGTTVVSVNVKADTKATESTVALDTHDDDGVAGIHLICKLPLSRKLVPRLQFARENHLFNLGNE